MATAGITTPLANGCRPALGRRLAIGWAVVLAAAATCFADEPLPIYPIVSSEFEQPPVWRASRSQTQLHSSNYLDVSNWPMPELPLIATEAPANIDPALTDPAFLEQVQEQVRQHYESQPVYLTAPSGQPIVLTPPMRLHSAEQTPLGNLQLRVSAELIRILSTRRDTQTQPYTDEILGTDITGIATTRSLAEAIVIPCAEQAIVELVIRGVTNARFTGQQDPVVTFGKGETVFQTRKTIVLNAGGIQVFPAQTAVKVESNVYDIQATRLRVLAHVIEALAWRRYYQQRGLAQAIGGEHAADRINQRIDDQTQERLSAVDEIDRWPAYLAAQEERLWPDDVRTWTTADSLYAVGHLSDDGRPTSTAPTLSQIPDLGIRAQAAAIETAAARVLAGETVNREWVEQQYQRWTGQPFPENLRAQADDDDKIRGATLASPKPMSVSFKDNSVQVTLHFESFQQDEQVVAGMDVSATYQAEVVGDQIQLRRVGEIDVLPPGFVIGKDRLGARQQVTRTLISKRFEKLAPALIPIRPISLPDSDQRPSLALYLTEVRAVDNWLALGFAVGGIR